jgi:DNA-binding FrmR family transcriptional regulator
VPQSWHERGAGRHTPQQDMLDLLRKHQGSIERKMVIERKECVDISSQLRDVQREGIDVGEILIGKAAEGSPFPPSDSRVG